METTPNRIFNIHMFKSRLIHHQLIQKTDLNYWFEGKFITFSAFLQFSGGKEMNRLLLWEILGMIFIIFLGSFMHFTYALSGGNPVVGAVSAVNESSWEHLKLSVFPALLFALIEARLIKQRNNFLPAKALGISLMPIFTVVLFYAYRLFLPDSLFMDILVFIVAVVIGQIASYMVMASTRNFSRYNMPSIAILILLPILFIIFTFYPPQIFLFQDPISGGYGIGAG